MTVVTLADSIEANIDNAQMSVSEGTTQLGRARDYQVGPVGFCFWMFREWFQLAADCCIQ